MARSETGKPGFDDLEDLEMMQDAELEQVIEKAQSILAKRLHTRIEELRSLARRAGFEVAVTRIGETLGVRRQAREVSVSGRQRVAAKYRNPENPAETWSGRGREPRWLAEKLAFGRKREEFAI